MHTRTLKYGLFVVLMITLVSCIKILTEPFTLKSTPLAKMPCGPLSFVPLPAAIDPLNLRAPNVELKTAPLGASTNNALEAKGVALYLTGKADPYADVIFYEACPESKIGCTEGLLYSLPNGQPQIESRLAPGSYALRAYSCVWQDRSQQLRSDLSRSLPGYPHSTLYCSREYLQLHFSLAAPASTAQLRLQRLEENLQRELFQLQTLLSAYQELNPNPNLALLAQINRTLALRGLLVSFALNPRLATNFDYTAQALRSPPFGLSEANTSEANTPAEDFATSCAEPALLAALKPGKTEQGKTEAKKHPQQPSPLAVGLSVLSLGNLYLGQTSKTQTLTYPELARALSSPTESILAGLGLDQLLLSYHLAQPASVLVESPQAVDQKWFESLTRWGARFYPLWSEYQNLRKFP